MNEQTATSEVQQKTVDDASCCGGNCGSCGSERNLSEEFRADKKQMVFDWLGDAPELVTESEFVEVQFKNTRKGYYLNNLHLELHKGDMVAVEGNPGHDIGEVTLTGYLVKLQMKKVNFHFDDSSAIKKVFRLAKPGDMERYKEAKAKEHETMLKSRKIAEDLKLEMKIGDVEYQGDGNKAIFYYIADGRVDFRQLIKVLADVFKVRIEMKQIGARQEAGRIGGIGPCGRELCCAGWMTKFMSVGTGAARFQDLSLNPQKLAGQCAKLKCCLNYEVDCYMEASKELLNKDVVLQTKDCDYHLFKTDILARKMVYSTGKEGGFNLVTISAERAWEVYNLNKKGVKVDSLSADSESEDAAPEFSDGVGDEDLNRFDKRKKNKRKKSGGNNGNAQQAEKQENKGGSNSPSQPNPKQKQQSQQNAKPQQQNPQNARPQQPQNQQGAKQQNQGNQQNRKPRPQGNGNPNNNQGNQKDQGNANNQNNQGSANNQNNPNNQGNPSNQNVPNNQNVQASNPNAEPVGRRAEQQPSQGQRPQRQGQPQRPQRQGQQQESRQGQPQDQQRQPRQQQNGRDERKADAAPVYEGIPAPEMPERMRRQNQNREHREYRQRPPQSQQPAPTAPPPPPPIPNK